MLVLSIFFILLIFLISSSFFPKWHLKTLFLLIWKRNEFRLKVPLQNKQRIAFSKNILAVHNFFYRTCGICLMFFILLKFFENIFWLSRWVILVLFLYLFFYLLFIFQVVFSNFFFQVFGIWYFSVNFLSCLSRFFEIFVAEFGNFSSSISLFNFDKCQTIEIILI